MKYKQVFGLLAIAHLAAIIIYIYTIKGTPQKHTIPTFEEETSEVYRSNTAAGDIQAVNKSNNQSSLKTIQYVRSQINPSTVECDRYQCKIESVQAFSKEADLTIFSEVSFYGQRGLPERPSGALWGFISGEPQNHMVNNKKWDEVFNYSSTYVRNSDEVMASFRSMIVKRPTHETWNFANNNLKPRALWLVSHCDDEYRFEIQSARMEYAKELSKYFPVDAYTKKPKCLQQLGVLAGPKPEPPIRGYTFYLAFESALCKDYISEKFWKILQGNISTIPVVLGGLSMEEYQTIAPPNSYIHVKNFTSPKALAAHLEYVLQHESAVNYYTQWRNEFYLQKKYTSRPANACYFCKQAHEKPQKVWNTFSKDFGKHNCLDVSDPKKYCLYYNMTCAQTIKNIAKSQDQE